MADSDSDSDMETDKPSAVPPKSRKQETFIREDAETIVDLADINAIGRITSNSIEIILFTINFYSKIYYL